MENLEQIDKDIKDINAIFVTHEHIDHIKGVGVLARKYNIPIYANKLTWDNMTKIGEVKSDLKFHFEKEESKIFGDIVVNSFGVSHDAANPQFYTFECDGKRVSILTDTGYISDKMIDYVKDSNTLVYESNHEENVLLSGSYPWKTKQRILSDMGHLSNTDSANYLTRIIGDNTKNIYLAHLSKENNTKELARMTAVTTLESKDIDCNNRICIFDTDPELPTDIIEI
ncbi:metallo-beta-lactamase family protein YycJ [Gemella bergeri ATCC 700627]|uniref:Metallo-beta-lactamase family protein YycJ n=1 Tax=Gemella bergeri ATCC 700627 TaxID=1321820 RepID=U2RRK1_9BACL|nr:metallo-beta-lactamase family protein YycJ [Gemella bergeri ATCC 700627]